MGNSDNKLAVLIDADNIQPVLVRELLAEVSRYGTANIKRAYGDWTTPNLQGWKKVLHEYAIQPIQQFCYTSGKNSTDSALIIDAMDLLHSGRLDGFCIVSSDSDFTRLATRIREAGLKVFGFGAKTTPQSFVAGCDKFIYTEILKPKESTDAKTEQSPEALRSMIREAINASDLDDGWVNLAVVGSMLIKNHPSFDSRNYGFRKLSELVRQQPYIEVKDVIMGDHPQMHLRLKPAPKKKNVAKEPVKA